MKRITLFTIAISTFLFITTTGWTGLTSDEKKLLERYIAEGRLNRVNLPIVLERLRRDPKREGALERALEGCLSGRIRRDLHDIRNQFRAEYGIIPILLACVICSILATRRPRRSYREN